MQRLLDVGMLLLIPVLISINWLVGGNLILHLPAIPLASARVVVGSLILLFFSNIKADQKSWSQSEKTQWWKNQLVLSLTGRVAYYLLSILALTMIPPFEAVLISALLPVFVLVIERIVGVPFKNALVPCLAALSTGLTIATLANTSVNHQQPSSNSLLGYLLMAAAMILYGVHLVIYKRVVKDKSASNPLFAQFLIAALILVPLDISDYSAFANLGVTEWLQFFAYAVICNLVPFILVHHCLKRHRPFTIGAVSILSPIFALIFKGLYTSAPISSLFVFLSIATCAAVFLTIKFDNAAFKRPKDIA